MGGGGGGSRTRSQWVKCVDGGAGRGVGGISPFMPDWTLGMLTGYSDNLVMSGGHADG